MRSSTNMGLRAAVASLITVGFTFLFRFDHPYWATLVSVAIVGETWGQSIKKALERLSMTALGGLVGFLLHAVLGQTLAARATMLFACVFWAVYFRARSYRWMTFFITVYVVFLFSVLGEFSVHVVFVRIFETALGCLAAIVAAVVVRPPRALAQLVRAFENLWAKSETHAREVFAEVLGENRFRDADACRLSLYRALLKLHEQRGITMYESFTPVKTTREWEELFHSTRALCQTCLALEESLAPFRRTEIDDKLRDTLRVLATLTAEAFVPMRVAHAPRLRPRSDKTVYPELIPVLECVRDIRRLTRRLNHQQRESPYFQSPKRESKNASPSQTINSR